MMVNLHQHTPAEGTPSFPMIDFAEKSWINKK